MVFRYPNGHPISYDGMKKQKMQVKEKKNNFANRGMRFEEAINESNTYYLSRGTAVIHKKPTPIQIVHVDYPQRSAAVIKEAYFREASTTDYNGVYQGKYIDFEAKETKNKTSFPFKNFHAHQIVHMKKCLEQEGICFVLLWFSTLQRCFFLDSTYLIHHWDQQHTGKKSLPLSLIEEIGIEIKPKIAPRIPYLDAVNQYLHEKETKNNGKSTQ
ncbi:Holliday junction resolvase RecU [Enterococcus saccharolyticus]|uniref:Holliday junction resolvase RecU n=1 Tax=Candidatus Enterococcus willemsii TaxID=1857215 RepID=A0ABQ6YW34_9ENTE|nr:MULTISPECIES: Holliday junction resolvase RecU [Enterococcus]KAF1301478.1 Holliday junction resolvase RecU [Enterococcus sp. CU12B]MCD5003128.1 Holliday junction resolvase RecU [Enterococcus saccharolyticus]